jgi:hypothetical protein
MPTQTDFSRILADSHKQTFAAWRNAVETSFDLGAELLALQKEYVLRVADVLGARATKSA